MILIHPSDNVLVSPEDGQKYARTDVGVGEPIVKYGYPIGEATKPIKAGEHVHSHNLRTRLSGVGRFAFHGAMPLPEPTRSGSFLGYRRPDGSVGIRNEIWILPTVGCVNSIAKQLSEKTGAICFSHPYGCSQLGDDMKITQLILRGLITHPNAGGVLVLGLGC